MVNATQIMQHGLGIDQRPQKCLEILLQAEREADEVVADILSAITDHDAKGVELKAEMVSLRAERGKRQVSEITRYMTLKALKVLDVMGSMTVSRRSMMKATMDQTVVGYQRPQLATNIYINPMLCNNVCVIVILHCTRSSSYRATCIIGWVSLRLWKRS